MMAAGAFTQAQSSLRWFIDNFSAIADWRATLVARRELPPCADHHRTSRRASTAGSIHGGRARRDRHRRLEIVSAAEWDRLRKRNVVIRAGERVAHHRRAGNGQDAAVSGPGRTLAVGRGATSPARRRADFLSAARHALSAARHAARGARLSAEGRTASRHGALPARCIGSGSSGWGRCSTQTRRWDRELSQDEQLSLAFARILIQAPPWVLIDGTFGSLDDDVLERGQDVFTHELAAHRHHPHRRPGQAHGLVLEHSAPGQGAARSHAAAQPPRSASPRS